MAHVWLGMSFHQCFIQTLEFNACVTRSLTDLGNDEMRVVVDLDKEYGNVRKDKTPTEVSVVVRKAKKLGLGTLQNYLDGKCQFDESVLEAISKQVSQDPKVPRSLCDSIPGPSSSGMAE